MVEATWTVTFGNETTTYTAATLIQLLVGKMTSTDIKHDQMLAIESLVQGIPAETWRSSTPEGLMAASFRLGYLYRLFLERNDVVVPKSPDASLDVSTGSEDTERTSS